jgi:DNA ligase (NAD+)
LESIDYQVGRTGAITPVANLQAVQLGGTTVRRASLHNSDQIEKLDIREKDQVYVEKGGEIIPKIIGVNLDVRPKDSIPVKYPTQCPVCETELIRKEGEAHHYCPNDRGCAPQLKGKIEHFIGRKMMNIDGLGAETVDQLFEAGLITNIADLYDLTIEKVLPLDRMAEKSANKLIDGLAASKQVSFAKVLFGLGIRYVGETVAKKLAKHFKSLENIQKATLEELINVDEIGERIAESLVEFFADDYNLTIIEKLKTAGLQLELSEDENQAVGVALEGKTIVVSGVFEMPRNDIKNLIEQNGGKPGSSISSKTDYLICGENMGPAKLKKAQDLEIKMITESEFLAMIDYPESSKKEEGQGSLF